MSFELSLFKLYERSLGACADELEAPRRSSRLFLRTTLRVCGGLCLAFLAASLGMLIILHNLVVDRAGCMGVALTTAAVAWENTVNASSSLPPVWPPPETVIRVSFLLNSSSVTSAWATGARLGGNSTADEKDDLWVWSGNHKTEGASPLRWVRWLPPTPAPAPAPANGTVPSNSTANPNNPLPRLLPATPGAHKAGNEGPDSGVFALSVATIAAWDAYHSPDYLASSRSEPVTMGQAQRTMRGYPVINLTVPLVCEEEAPASSAALLLGFSQWTLFSALVDTDALALNAFTRSLPYWHTGWMVSASTGESWGWSGLFDDEEAWGMEPYIELQSLPNYPIFVYPQLTRTASWAWRGFLQVTSQSWYMVMALLALYVASTAAAMLMREVCSHGTGAIFVVLAALDACRRPSRIFSGLCGCVTGSHHQARSSARTGPQRARELLSTHAAKTCPTIFALFLCCCGTAVCCPCCDLVSHTEWTAQRLRRPRPRRGPPLPAGGSEVLAAAGIDLNRNADGSNGRERFFDEDDGDDDNVEAGEDDAATAQSNTAGAAAAEADVEAGLPAGSTNSSTGDADAATTRREGARRAEGRNQEAGAVGEGGTGEGQGEEAEEDEDEDEDEDDTLGSDSAEGRMMEFAWLAASAFYPYWGYPAQQVRAEAHSEESRLRHAWQRDSDERRRLLLRQRPTAAAAAAAGARVQSERDTTGLMTSAPGASSGDLSAVVVDVSSTTTTAAGAAAMPPQTTAEGGANASARDRRSSSNSSALPLAVPTNGSNAAGLQRRRRPLRVPAAVDNAFVAACGWCCCRPLHRSSAIRASNARGSWLHPSWWRMVTREQLSFSIARWQGTMWALAVFLALLGGFGSGTIELKSHPAGLALSLWSIVLVAEYWSLIYSRTVMSMLVFSRAVTYAFVALFVYWCSFRYPPMGAALAAMCFFLAFVMVLLVSEVEAPALARGKVSPAVPRQAMAVEGWGRTGRALTVATAVNVALQQRGQGHLVDEDGVGGWHAFRGLPHSFSIFNPLTTRLDRIPQLQPAARPSVYDEDVPQLHGNNGVDNNANNNEGAAGEDGAAAAAGAPEAGDADRAPVV